MRKLLLFTLLLTSVSSNGRARADGPATEPTTKPTTQPSPPTTLVQRGSMSIAIDGQGSFDPVDPFEVRLRLKAYAGELAVASIVANGVSVKKDQVLLEIDPVPFNRVLSAVENEDLAAKANLERTIAESKVAEQADVLAARQQQDAQKEAEEGVKWFETVDGPQMLKQVDLVVAQSKNQMNDEQDELDQLKKLYKSEELTNATADIVVKRAVRQLDVSKTLYSMAEDRAKKTRTFNYPTLKQRVYDGLETAHEQFTLFEAAQQQGKVLRQTNLASAHAATEAADLKLNEMKADAEKLTVRAPADGVLYYGQVLNGVWSGGDPRTLKIGEHVAAQAILMTVYQPGRMRAVMEVPEGKFFAIQSGQKVSISPVAFPEMKYEGMCDCLPRTPIGASAGNYALTLSTGEVDAKIVAGMKALVHMDVPLVNNAVLVPMSAISNATVWVKNGDSTEARHVLTGRSDGKSMEILSGVKEGEEVLTQAKQ